jgi:cyclopropane-fatty-acyl-phospholipid synthase
MGGSGKTRPDAGAGNPKTAAWAAAAEGRFTVEDWHNFGADYAPTLRAWHAKLVGRYGERFYRMYVFYFLSRASAFEARVYQMRPILFAKRGLVEDFRAR